jgi:hypothetical protein
MSNVRLAVISAVLLATSLHALTQESTTSSRPEVIVPSESPNGSADSSNGKWVGDWQSRGRPAGSMEMEVDVKGDQVTGQVRSTGSPGCSVEWAKLTGVKKDEKIFAQYDLGGRCGKVDVIYAIDREGRVMTGTWSSEYPGWGTFRLTK